MSARERRIWSEWDNRDSKLTIDTKPPKEKSAQKSKEKKGTHVYRQATAHKKLLDYSRTAMNSVSSAESSKGVYPSMESDDLGVSGTTVSANSFSDRVTSDEEYATSSGDQYSGGVSPGSFGSRLVSSRSESSDESPKQPLTPTNLSINQLRVMDKVVSSLRKKGLEVLKLNRENKWQPRYVTISREFSVLRSPEFHVNEGEKMICPEALLWVKRFNSRNQNYSITSIDKQGRGGIMMSSLKKVSASSRSDLEFPIPRKHQNKFKDSITVQLECCDDEGSERTIVFCCRRTNEAHFLCTGLRVIIDILERESKREIEVPDSM